MQLQQNDGFPEMFAEVIVDIKAHDVDHTFHYKIPQSLALQCKVGARVYVPFANRKLDGYIVKISSHADIDIAKAKSILGVQDVLPPLTEELVSLSTWLANRYCTTRIACIQAMVPYRTGTQTKTIQAVQLTDQAREDFKQILSKIPARVEKQKAILQMLYDAAQLVPVRDVLLRLQTTRSTVERLLEQGFVQMDQIAIRRDPYAKEWEQNKPLPLTTEQEQALEPIQSALKQNLSTQFLLHGITGSGKTEVYLQAMAACLAQNRQAIMLVPEISLTPQTVERFKQRFGDAVAVLHSRLSAGERYDEWLRIREQKVKIVVGARSAIFAPFQALGLIIIDEEHESSYKQEDQPKYVTHEVAAQRAEFHHAVLIYGSATPSFERMLAAKNKEINYLKLSKRVFGQSLPEIEIVDMRTELRDGNRTMFSRSLRAAIESTIQKQKQMVLFLNRRGHSTFMLCRNCGEALKCPHCDISLTLHKKNQWTQLRCHYCGYARPVDEKCPHCGSAHIRHFGTGTQKVEEALKAEFPALRVIRMDVDTTTKKGAHERLLDQFRKRQADVLLGTQMIAKGLDFPDVTLVGVIAADMSLHMPDFRANERTFQLLSQVAGRAGRHTEQGSVVIQTYMPENAVIQAAAKQDFYAFFAQEMQIRYNLHYPPFVEFASWLITHESETAAAILAGNLAVKLQQVFDGKAVQVMSAAPAPFAKINNKYRYYVLIKYTDWWGIADDVRKIYVETLRNVKKEQGTLSIDIQAQRIL